MLVLTVLGRVDEQNRNLQRQCLHLETLTISEVANCFVTLKVVNYLGQLTSMGCRQMEGKCDMDVSLISNDSFILFYCVWFLLPFFHRVDTGLITISQYILLDPVLLVFIMLSVFFMARTQRLHREERYGSTVIDHIAIWTMIEKCACG